MTNSFKLSNLRRNYGSLYEKKSYLLEMIPKIDSINELKMLKKVTNSKNFFEYFQIFKF